MNKFKRNKPQKKAPPQNGVVKKNKIKKKKSTKLVKQKLEKKPKIKNVKTNESEVPTLVNLPKETKQSIPPYENPLTNPLNVFKWLIHPHNSDKFLENKWERGALHIKRNNPNYFVRILDSSQLDKIFRSNLVYYTRNVDVVSYENGVKELHNPEGRAVPSALWDFYSNGCSIRLLNPQTYNKKVHTLLATLQEFFGTMVGANVYLTPPESQGFAPHFDDIEAFILQLEGRKHWKLYHPCKEDVLARHSSRNFTPSELGEPFKELTLEAGDLLYFPRGTIHQGSTDSDAHSLHITVSVYQNTAWVDLLEKALPNALRNAAQANLSLRQGLPLDYLKHVGVVNGGEKSKLRTQIHETCKKLALDLIASHLDLNALDEAADELGRKFMHDSMPPVLEHNEIERCSKGDGDYLHAGKVKNRIEFCLSTKVRLIRFHCLRVVKQSTDNVYKVYYNTENANVYHGEEEQWLEIDGAMLEIVKVLKKSYPAYVEVEQLPHKDDLIKLQLVSDLWEHGLLLTEVPLLGIDNNSDSDDSCTN